DKLLCFCCDDEKDDEPDDYISPLPNDILISILSRLTLKEAAITSNLSRRWRYLWTHTAGLDFDANDMLDRIAADPKSQISERPKYIKWVIRVVRQHQGEILEAVRICFDLENSSKCAIDNWVKFAVSKGVQKLELDLMENGETLHQPMRNYMFPYKQLCKGLFQRSLT
ncbi:putative F-box/LRR-repeat protein at1g56400, partial [Phtheirospermum japonicum]